MNLDHLLIGETMKQIKTIDDVIHNLNIELTSQVEDGENGVFIVGFEAGIEVALQDIGELKSQLDKYKWNKVEDGFPKVNELVEVFCHNKDIFIGNLFEGGFKKEPDIFNEGWSVNGFSITHWRYLDKPQQ